MPWEFLVTVPTQKNRVPSDSRGSITPGSPLPLYEFRGSGTMEALGPCPQPTLCPCQQHRDGGRSLSSQVPGISRTAPRPGESTEHPPKAELIEPASPCMPGRFGEVLHLPLQHLVPWRKLVTSLHCNRRCHNMEHLPASLLHISWMSQHRFSTTIPYILVACQQSQLTLVPGRVQPTLWGVQRHPHSPGFLHQLPVEGTGMEWDLTILMCSWGSVVYSGEHDGRCSGDT